MFLNSAPARIVTLTLALAATPLMAEDLTSIIAEAPREGALNLAGFSRGECSFDRVIDSFAQKYPAIKVTELMPEASSGEQLAVLRETGANSGPMVPDVVQLDYLSGPLAKQEGLFQPYIAENLNELPLAAYDVEYGDRHWSGAYFYVPAMLVNTDAVPNLPKSWADLLKPEYAGQIAFAADPTTSPIATMAVLSAGRSLDSSGTNAASLGLDHFATIAKAGNLAPMIGNADTVASGETPILILSDADALAIRDAKVDTAPLQVVIPMKGAIADIHIMAISAAAPHPNAAKLWFEHFYSSVTQTELLRGDCHPILWADLADWDLVPEEFTVGKPSNLIYSIAHFPSFDDRSEAAALVASNWDSVVTAP